MRKIEVIASFAAIAAAANGAHAQQAPVDADTTSESDIVVTAARRAEIQSNVPIPITTISGEALKRNNAANSQDLTTLVPGLVFARNSNFNAPSIRGLGPRGNIAGDEANVATYFDGVYMPDAASTLLDLANIDRVEVLKGPQGTLFGRNATGGAISIVTKKPQFEWHAGASATYSRFNYYRLTGYLNGEVVPDVVAVSVSGVQFGDDGYIRNTFLNKTTGQSDGYLVRGRILMQAGPDLELQLNGLKGSTKNNVMLNMHAINGNARVRIYAPGNPQAPIFNPTGIPLSRLITSEPYTTANGEDPSATTRIEMADAHFAWDLGFATLTGLASFGSTATTTRFYVENSPLLISLNDFVLRVKSRNQELVLTSAADAKVSWLLGATAYQGTGRYDPLLAAQRAAPTGAYVAVLDLLSGQRTYALAGFGEVTVAPVENLFITAGARYSRERKVSFYRNRLGTVPEIGATTVFNNFSPRGVIRYQFAPNANVYASITRGFKSGIYSVTTAAGSTIPVFPETTTAYEAGIKGRLLPNVYVDGSVFHYDSANLQVNTIVQVNGVGVPRTQNAASSKVTGAELNINWDATPSLRINGALSLLRARYTDFPAAVLSVPVTVNGVPTLAGNVSQTINASGNSLIRAPARTLSIGGTWTRPLLGGKIIANATAFFSSKFYETVSNHVVQPAYEVVNASLTWRAPGAAGAYVTVFGQNLTNQVYSAGVLSSADGDFRQEAKPRRYGITIGFDI